MSERKGAAMHRGILGDTFARVRCADGVEMAGSTGQRVSLGGCKSNRSDIVV